MKEKGFDKYRFVYPASVKIIEKMLLSVVNSTSFVRDIIFFKFLVKSRYGYDTIVEQKRSGDGYDGQFRT